MDSTSRERTEGVALPLAYRAALLRRSGTPKFSPATSATKGSPVRRVFAVSLSAFVVLLAACSLGTTAPEDDDEDVRSASAAINCKKKKAKKKKNYAKKCLGIVDGGADAKTDAGGPTTPTEICNGKDDDDDDRVDEGFACIKGAPTICTLPNGSFGLGTCSATSTVPAA